MREYLLNNPQVVVTLLIGVFTLLITLIYNWRNYRLNHQKMEKELFVEFNKRYDELNDSLLMLEVSMTIEDIKNTLSKTQNKTLYNVVIDYFNLCSEQYYWQKKKRISPEIWNAWSTGMNFYYNNYPVVRELWKNEIDKEGFKSYYLKKDESFFKEIKKVL